MPFAFLLSTPVRSLQRQLFEQLCALVLIQAIFLLDLNRFKVSIIRRLHTLQAGTLAFKRLFLNKPLCSHRPLFAATSLAKLSLPRAVYIRQQAQTAVSEGSRYTGETHSSPFVSLRVSMRRFFLCQPLAAPVSARRVKHAT